ncbi:hypothetical protein HPB50_000401 [Hyalomma asiaticum]|uniref:Uncharacterized protein n=1 Tax=Hyalomma asiaticum TaxID=266040 RepID=A0ACB7TCB4_HYAAI|nr:hypothetical protein HPB50_000401 [Hyalomma asiaticum]
MERLQKKQTTLRQAIDGIIAAASDLLQVPAAAIGELEESLDNLVEQADELRTVNEAIEKKIELQELDAALTDGSYRALANVFICCSSDRNGTGAGRTRLRTPPFSEACRE